ncbi:TOPRS ligase, partial [Pedionomus torquatus]|nr:TOPRS ligase [Pedionomus torquatus]
ETQWQCPICYGTEDGIAYVIPCSHQICLGCLIRWAAVSSNCPLCNGRMETLKFSIRGENDYLRFIIPSSEESLPYIGLGGGAPRQPDNRRSHRPVPATPSSPQQMAVEGEQGAAGTEAVGGILPNMWGQLFRRNRELLNPLMPWLRREFEAVLGEQWWLAVGAEALVLQLLCFHGLDEEAIAQQMQPALGENADLLVHGLITHIRCQCIVEAQRMLHFVTDREEGDDDISAASSSSPSSSSSSSSSSSPTSSSNLPSSSSTSVGSAQEQTCSPPPASSSTRAVSNVEEHPRTLETILHGGSGHPTSPLVPAEQEQPQQQQEEAAGAGPSLPGGSSSPSASNRASGRTRQGPRCPPKRRAHSPPDSPQPPKKPPCGRR